LSEYTGERSAARKLAAEYFHRFPKDRTARGEETELHYPDGMVYVISGVERNP
jgi:hypothetical protein